MPLYYKLIFLWVFISACAKPTDWQRPYDIAMLAEGSTLYKIKQNGKWGLADANGQILLPVEYDLMSGFDNGLLRVYKGTQLRVVNYKGQLVGALGRYDRITPINSHLWLVIKNHKYGILNTLGQELAPLRYNQIDYYVISGLHNGYSYHRSSQETLFDDEKAQFLMHAPKYAALMDEKGHYLIPPQYDSIEPYRNVFYVHHNRKVGVWNSKYQQIVPFMYDSINRNILMLNGKYGYLDNEGKVKVQPKYDDLTYLNYDWGVRHHLDYSTTLRFKKCRKWGVIQDAKVLIPPLYDDIYVRCQYNASAFEESHYDHYYYEVHNNGKMGWLDSLGKAIVPCEYDDIQYTADRHVFEVFDGYMAGLVKSGGTVILPPSIRCSSIDNFHAGLARVVTIMPSQQQFNVCFVDTKGRWVGFPEYENISDFSDKGLAFAIKNKKLGIIDTLGNEILPFIYDLYTSSELEYDYPETRTLYDYFEEKKEYGQPYKRYHKNFTYGAEIISKHNKFGLVNEFGKLIIPTKYDEIERLSPSLYSVVLNDKEGLFNKYGKMILAVKYDYVYLEKDGTYSVKLDGEYYDVAKNGALIRHY